MQIEITEPLVKTDGEPSDDIWHEYKAEVWASPDGDGWVVRSRGYVQMWRGYVQVKGERLGREQIGRGDCLVSDWHDSPRKPSRVELDAIASDVIRRARSHQ